MLENITCLHHNTIEKTNFYLSEKRKFCFSSLLLQLVLNVFSWVKLQISEANT